MNKYIILGIIIFLGLLTSYMTYNYHLTSENTVIIGYIPSNHHSALFVAQEKKLFEKEGINVQIVPFRNGEDLLRAAEYDQIDIGYCGITPVMGAIDQAEYNQIDMGYCGITPVMGAIDQDKPIKVVASVNIDGSGIVVSDEIDSSKDLKGKKIVIPKKGSIQDVLLRYYLLKNNISPDEIKIEEMEVQVMDENLENDNINAYVAWEPFVSQADISNEDKSEILLYSNEIFSDHPCCVVIATEKFIKSRPQFLRKVLKVHVTATEYLKKNPEELAHILSRKLGTDVELERLGLENVEFIAVPSQDFMEKTLTIHRILKELGYVKNDITIDEIFDLKYLP